MSEQLTRLGLGAGTGITRRTALRGAAWTAPAITIAVSAPAYASTSGGQVTPTAVGWTRNGTVLTATTALTSATTLTGVNCLATFSYNGGNGTQITTTSIALPWIAGTRSAASAQFQIPTVAGGQSVAFQPSFDLSNVSYVSITWSFVFTWAGGGGATMGGTYVK